MKLLWIQVLSILQAKGFRQAYICGAIKDAVRLKYPVDFSAAPHVYEGTVAKRDALIEQMMAVLREYRPFAKPEDGSTWFPYSQQGYAMRLFIVRHIIDSFEVEAQA